MDNWRFRTNWRGVLVLQRRVKAWAFYGPLAEREFRWRDAKTEDLAAYYEALHALKAAA
jgi:hypothetical protein